MTVRRELTTESYVMNRQSRLRTAVRPVALVVLLLLPGCGTVRLETPPGREVRILQADEPVEIHSRRTVWFWLWGARPISDNTTKSDIEKYDLREVRMHTEQTFFETITNPITALVSIVRRTLIVEGNVTVSSRRDVLEGGGK